MADPKTVTVDHGDVDAVTDWFDFIIVGQK